MNILAIDTSTQYCFVGLERGREYFTPKGFPLSIDSHSNELSLRVCDVLEQASISASDLDVIVLGVGPGSFTGLRIGFSFVKGLLFDSGITLTTISTLAAMCQGGYESVGKEGRYLAALDARREELFFCMAMVDREGFKIEVCPQILPCQEVRLVLEREDHQGFVCQPLRDAETRLSGGVCSLSLRVDEIDLAKALISLHYQGVCKKVESSLEALASLEPEYLRAVAAQTIEERKLLSANHKK